MVFMEESELSSKRWASAPRRPDSPCVLGAPTSREAAGPPVQLEPVDLSVKTPVVLQVPRYSPAAALITAARRIPSPSTAPTPPPLCASTDCDAKFQVKFCCCCIGLRNGASIIGALSLISMLISTILLFTTGDEYNRDEHPNAYLEAMEENMKFTQIAGTMLNILSATITGLMVYGNIKGDKKLMLPYLYIHFISVALIALVLFIGTLTFIFMGYFGSAFFFLLILSIAFFIVLYFWEVVRCRVLELDHLEQPRSGLTQQDPELPAYEDVQDPATMNMPSQEKSAMTYPNSQFSYE